MCLLSKLRFKYLFVVKLLFSLAGKGGGERKQQTIFAFQFADWFHVCLPLSICTLSPLCCQQQQSLLWPVNSFLRIQTVDNYPSLYRFPQSYVHFVGTLQKHPTTVPNSTQPISLTRPCDTTSPHQFILDFGSGLNISHATPHLLQCDYPTPWAQPSALMSPSLSC